MKKKRTRSEEIQFQIDVLSVRRVASRIAIKLFESAKDAEELEEIRELLDRSGIYSDMREIIKARDALIALAKKMNVDIDTE